MTETSKCSRCGTELIAGSGDGLCPRCLIALNLTVPTEVPDATGADAPASTAPPPAPAEIAKHFPQLEILSLLGKGGMGAVYKARQKQLDRIVALKILPPGVNNDPAFAERFAREARALAKLNHPNIVTLYEFGQADGLFYFLMEYVDGVNLRELMHASRLDAKEALAIVPQICEALQYAHKRGIVHRDIKPENLLLSSEGDLKVADFGLAKLVGRAETLLAAGSGVGQVGLANPTQPTSDLSAGRIMGTPQYMAPEQVAHPLEVDHRADIYALGVVFYQMLTGELPAGKFVAPSRKVAIDARLDQVVQRALEREPERRYQQAAEVKTAVDTIVQTPRTSAKPKLAGRAMLVSLVAALSLITLLLLYPRALSSVHAGRNSTPEHAQNSQVLQENDPQNEAVPSPRHMQLVASLATPDDAAKSQVLEQSDPISVPINADESAPSPGIFTPTTAPAARWQRRTSADMLSGRSSATTTWTGKELIVFGGEGPGTGFEDGALYDFAKDRWELLPAGETAPTMRTGASAVWSGREVLIWGGFGGINGNDVNRGDGSRFDPVEKAWVPISTESAPDARFDFTAVWSGKEMLVWGGYNDSHSRYAGAYADAHLGNGGGYDPARDRWRHMSEQGAPSKRFQHTAVWTGKEMMIWGGFDTRKAFGDGARYNPVTDTWKPVSRRGAPAPRGLHVAVWTGKEMVVWGGVYRGDEAEGIYFKDGARYNPVTDTWKPISKSGVPRGRILTQAVWTGTEMVLWGGVNDSESGGVLDPGRFVGTGGRYNPAADAWTEIPASADPSPRLTGLAWTGKGLLIFGGYNGTHLNDTWFLPFKK